MGQDTIILFLVPCIYTHSTTLVVAVRCSQYLNAHVLRIVRQLSLWGS